MRNNKEDEYIMDKTTFRWFYPHGPKVNLRVDFIKSFCSLFVGKSIFLNQFLN